MRHVKFSFRIVTNDILTLLIRVFNNRKILKREKEREREREKRERERERERER